MKAVKKLFYGLMIICMLLCGVILVCAMVPGLTERIAVAVYGEKTGNSQQQENEIQGKPVYVITGSTTAGIDWEHMPFQNLPGYVVPGKEQISVPKEQKGKNGYQGINEEHRELNDTDAEKLQEELGTGNLGSAMQFSELFYPYYAMLTEDMKELYRQIYANAMDVTVSFQPVTEVNTQQLYTVFEAVTGDHPELFWLDTGYSCKKTADGRVVEITLKYYDLVRRLEGAKAEFEKASEEILKEARQLETEEDRERFIHDTLTENVDYSLLSEMNQSAYSAMVGGSTVCAGYARAFQYLMIQLGIPCYYCMGYAGEDHAWNIVFVNGMYRNVDVTWDDSEGEPYEFFNRPDSFFSRSHMRKSLSVYLPACPDEGAAEMISPLDGIQGLINPNPVRPLTLADRGPVILEEDKSNPSEQESEEGLREAGIKAADVLRSVEEYYKDCSRQMISKGTGQIQFSNCIPASLWESIEGAYTSRKHLEGYVNDALKEMEVGNFAINLQVVRLGGGYYRLYHTIATW